MAVKETNPSNNDGKEGKKKLIIILVIAGVLIAVLVGIIIFLLRSRVPVETTIGTEAAEAPRREVITTPDNIEEVAAQMEQEAKKSVPAGYYTVTQNYDWHFASGDAVSDDAYVENKAENTNDVYFDLFLENDMENPIYMSPVIPLGMHLDEIKLDTLLEAGSYDCILVYHLIDEEQETISTVSMSVTVTVDE